MSLRPLKRAGLNKALLAPGRGAAAESGPATRTTQQSKLLQALFSDIAEDQRISVLHIGPALQETLDFFAHYRCKIHFLDVFSELPLASQNEDGDGDQDEIWLQQQFHTLLDLPAETRFELCLFWDLFNYLDEAAIAALMRVLQPHLSDKTRAHGFAVHNTRAPRKDQIYAIAETDTLTVRERASELVHYSPRTQGQLDKLLSCFRFDRTVLLPDGRLEWVLSAAPAPHGTGIPKD